MENKDLRFLKKHYGDRFSKLCRDLFPTILETEGLLTQVITEHFDSTSTLYEDIIKEGLEDDFKTFVYSCVDIEKMQIRSKTTKTPTELLDEAGYILYPECTTYEDIQKFKKYYAPDEEICTFRTNRLKYCRVFFAVKKDIENIKREDFPHPTRQDEYGTSCISIQFTKTEPSFVSIKNRYNHKVNNPDATFSNNLDSIVDGLTHAFEKEYGIILSSQIRCLDLFPYVFAEEKFYRYNIESNNVYYCENNIVVDNYRVLKFDKAKYILFDGYVIDKVKKEIYCYDKDYYSKNHQDGFTKSFGQIKTIKETQIKNGREITITPEEGEDILIRLNNHDSITYYKNNNIKVIEDNFLRNALSVEEVEILNCEKIGNNFLRNDDNIKSVRCFNVIEVGNDFLLNSQKIQSFKSPKLRRCGDGFLGYAFSLKTLNVDSLETTGKNCLQDAYSLESFSGPSLISVNSSFLENARNLTYIDVPNLMQTNFRFLYGAEKLKYFNGPSVLSFKDSDCFRNAYNMQEFHCRLASCFGEFFLSNAKSLKILDAPNVQDIESYAFDASHIEQVDLSGLKDFGIFQPNATFSLFKKTVEKNREREKTQTQTQTTLKQFGEQKRV